MPLKLGNTILNQGEYDKNISWWTDTILHVTTNFYTPSFNRDIEFTSTNKRILCGWVLIV